MKFNIPFLKFSLPFGFVSICLVSLSIYLIAFGKGFRYGTDFTGGIELTLTFEKALAKQATTKNILQALTEAEILAQVQPVLGENPRFFIRLTVDNPQIEASAARDKIKNKIQSVLVAAFGEESFRVDQFRSIGGTISSENRRKALNIIFFVCVGIIAYTSFRFKYQYGLATLIAVIHDVTIMLGLLVYFDKEINVFTITAALTIFGYSVNDTIVLFDRIRESVAEKKYLDFRELVNSAINGVFSRTLITSLTTLTVVGGLFLFSQGAINDFSFALLVGLVVGTYSSIYVATSFILLWHRYKPLI